MSNPVPFDEVAKDSDFDIYHYANKSAVLGCWITFTLISGLLNAAVSVLTIRRLVSLPSASTHRPQLTVILASCLVFIFSDAVVEPMAIHEHRVDWEELESTWSCDTLVAMEVMSSMVSTVSTLLVSGLVVVEGFRVQSLVALSSKVHTIVAIVVIVMSLLYGLVVIVPVFFFRFLYDHSHPCYQDTLSMPVDSDSIRDLYIADILVPDVLLFCSCLLLLIVYFIRPAGNKVPVGSTQLGLSPGSGPTNAANTDASGGRYLGPPVNQQHPEGTESAHRDPFPWYVLLTAATSFLFTFLFFLQAYADLRTTLGHRIRVWFSARLLESLRGVVVPCCWLINREVRAGAYCGSPSPGNTARIRQQRGEDMVKLTRF